MLIKVPARLKASPGSAASLKEHFRFSSVKPLSVIPWHPRPRHISTPPLPHLFEMQRRAARTKEGSCPNTEEFLLKRPSSAAIEAQVTCRVFTTVVVHNIGHLTDCLPFLFPSFSPCSAPPFCLSTASSSTFPVILFLSSIRPRNGERMHFE